MGVHLLQLLHDAAGLAAGDGQRGRWAAGVPARQHQAGGRHLGHRGLGNGGLLGGGSEGMVRRSEFSYVLTALLRAYCMLYILALNVCTYCMFILIASLNLKKNT